MGTKGKSPSHRPKGWGGAANGAGNQKAGPGRPKGSKTGQGKRSVADLMAEAGGREEAAERWMDILRDPDHPHHAAMIEKAASRMDGAPVQASVIATVGSAEELTDSELAAIASGRRGGVAAPEDDQA